MENKLNATKGNSDIIPLALFYIRRKIKMSRFKVWIATVVIVFSCIIIGVCCDSGGGSSSGKKWGDLTDQEKENARWAYNVKSYIDEQ